ncbi:ATP-binding protein [Pseudomonas chlororaphis]|uniref:ATP-binding protein n=1 Tax=Pseudomonas chlororaphis TaxID=587753 RepID=UPI0023675663|nr:transporter substrate-binding domain-containing protein [Pseudomonas chlororaphis]WDH34460.1 transporter substrate-binding domain-containing protein [Pseudomonas chlororaphis]WDH40544.1 transporter substrate-binding domain-containing protein [Pseudomonas chlororaphis]
MPNPPAGLPRLILWIMLLLTSVASLGAAEPEPAPLSLATLMAMRQTLPPRPLRVAEVSASNEQPEPRGNDVLNQITNDYLEHISQFLELPIQRVPYPSVDSAIAGLTNGDIDLMPRATEYERKQPGFVYSQPYLDNEPIIVGRIADKDLSPDLAGKRVLVPAYYVQAETVGKAYPKAELIVINSIVEGLQRLSDGEADALIGDQLRTNFYMRSLANLKLQNKYVANLPAMGFSFAARGHEDNLVPLINAALKTVSRERKQEILQHWERSPWLFAPTDSFALNSAEDNWLKHLPSLNLIAHEIPNYLYRKDDGQWAGLAFNVLRSLADDYQLQLNIIDSQSPDIDRQRLERDEAQIALSLAPTPVRQKRLLFSDGFGTDYWAFITREGASSPSSLAALGGRRLAIAAGHPLQPLLQSRYPSIELVLTDHYSQSLHLVEQGMVDATLNSAADAQQLDNPRLRAGKQFQAQAEPLVFAVSAKHPELLSILNKLLYSLKTSDGNQHRISILARPATKGSLWAYLPSWVWQSAALVLVLVLLSFYWNWRLRIQIRQRRVAQNQLKDQLAFQFALLNGLPIPLYVRDLQGRLSTCNHAYEQFFGRSLDEMRGTTPQEQGIAPRALALDLEEQHQRLLDNRQSQFLDSVIEVDGQAHHIYQWLVPFYTALGKQQGLLGGWIDISVRKHLEHKLLEAQQQAVDASAAKSQFLATMSHELRTPLNAMVGLLELETSGASTPSQNLSIAQQSAQSMIDLIGNILDLDKVETGQMELVPSPTDLDQLLANCLELFAAQAREKHLELKLQHRLPPERRYQVDALRLTQILHNLLSNALKFTNQGWVELSVQELDSGPRQSRLMFHVSDTGIGIAEDQQPQIFAPYQQAHAEIAHLHGGSGLGLSICKQLVELMGGSIRLASAAGQGCRVSFELTLPWQPDEDEPQHALQGATAVAGLNVLIVDDVSTNGLVLEQQLLRLGHRGTYVSNGKAALQAWEQGHFDVLVTDCNMPHMDGYALARNVRAAEQSRGLPRIPIIGYTARALADEKQRCQAAGMDDLMIKPIVLERLREILGKLKAPGLSRSSLNAPLTPPPAPAPDEEAAATFDLSYLEGFQNDPQLKERLLQELRRNLEQERELLSAPLPDTPEFLEQWVHRVSGLACTVDSPALMRACLDLQRATHEGEQALEAQRHAVLSVIERMLGDIERHA